MAFEHLLVEHDGAVALVTVTGLPFWSIRLTVKVPVTSPVIAVTSGCGMYNVRTSLIIALLPVKLVRK